MNHVDDAIDIAISTLFIAFMLALGVWCMATLKDLYSQPVIEKTAPTVQLNKLAPEYEYNGASCLLSLVVNDTHCPSTKVVEYYSIREAQIDSFYTTTYYNEKDAFNENWFKEVARRGTAGQPGYDSTIGHTQVKYSGLWFNDKEVNINAKWDSFFWEIDWASNSKWHLFYDASGNPDYWMCVIIRP